MHSSISICLIAHIENIFQSIIKAFISINMRIFEPFVKITSINFCYFT
nr:MAG TPA: hypothetical protein [Caudoviricetes sp.]